ncbi:putative integrase [Puccinia sorghi]|uniref:Putative integrase n=1 Tax=Puccinia sorghi TaxID=27349 RepID=A0A0L6UZ55_9BASI|nr:putative integrase [Puccinia sorghi]
MTFGKTTMKIHPILLTQPGYSRSKTTRTVIASNSKTYFPMLRMLLLYSLHKNLKVQQFDFQGAFLHDPLNEDVFIKNPKGVNRPTPYLKLKKLLYGLKQSPKNWYETLTTWLN